MVYFNESECDILKKRFLTIFFILAISSFMMLVMAGVDDQGNPNDPTVNDRANACYDGGSMEGKCDSEWEWTCGYYLIRWENDNNFGMPPTCLGLIQSDVEVSLCITTNFAPIRVTGAINTSPNVNFYDYDCTTIQAEGTMVQAADQTTAETTCTTLLSARTITSNGVSVAGGDLPNDYWFCNYAIP